MKTTTPWSSADDGKIKTRHYFGNIVSLLSVKLKFESKRSYAVFYKCRYVKLQIFIIVKPYLYFQPEVSHASILVILIRYSGAVVATALKAKSNCCRAERRSPCSQDLWLDRATCQGSRRDCPRSISGRDAKGLDANCQTAEMVASTRNTMG